MHFQNTYQNFKLEVKAVIPGSLSCFMWAYCKTINCPEVNEPYFIRKAISFWKLSKYIRTHISNDFDSWYQVNQDSQALCEVLSTIINSEEGRVEIYNRQPHIDSVRPTFRFEGINMDFVLVPLVK